MLLSFYTINKNIELNHIRYLTLSKNNFKCLTENLEHAENKFPIGIELIIDKYIDDKNIMAFDKNRKIIGMLKLGE